MKKIIFVLMTFIICYASDFDKKDFSTIKQSCEANNLDACYLYAWLYHNESDKSNEKTKEILKNLCDELNYAKACNTLASDFFTINKEQYYKKSCELGFLEACYSLSKINDDCSIVKNNLKNMDNYTLSLIYIDGKCVKQDLQKAQELAKKSCQNDDLKSCEIYHRTIFDNNEIIKQSIKKAQIECKNDINACMWLIQIYRFGFLNQEKDLKKAANIALDGCSRGDANTCFTLIDLAKRGHKINYETLKDNMQKGCLLGNEKMCKFLQGR